MKYLYKYTFKGHDRASIELDFDEVRRYLDKVRGPSRGLLEAS